MNLIGYSIVFYLLIVNSYASVLIAHHVWTWFPYKKDTPQCLVGVTWIVKGTAKAPDLVLFKLNTLRGNKTVFLTSSVRKSGPVLFILESPPRGGGGGWEIRSKALLVLHSRPQTKIIIWINPESRMNKDSLIKHSKYTFSTSWSSRLFLIQYQFLALTYRTYVFRFNLWDRGKVSINFSNV